MTHPDPTPVHLSPETLGREKPKQKAEETYKSALTKPFPSVSNTLKAWRMVSSGSVPRSSTHRQGEHQGEEARQRLGLGQVPWPLQRPRAQGASSPASSPQ